MEENKSEVDFQSLEDETVRLLTELQSAVTSYQHTAVSTLETELMLMWKSIPMKQSSISELDIKVGMDEYKNSSFTVKYLILYYLLENDTVDIADAFIAENRGDREKLEKTKEDYLRYKKVISDLEGENLVLLEDFTRKNAPSGLLDLYLTNHRFLTLIAQNRVDKALRMSLVSLRAFLPAYIDEVKASLKLLVSPRDVQKMLSRNRKRLLEQFRHDYLAVCEMPGKCFLNELFETGTRALEQLSRSGNLFFEKGDTTLPVEIRLEKGRNYHTLFVCPVLKSLCSGENGPALLECGHVISIVAASVLSKNGTIQSFKCPYCPEISRYSKILELKV
jgi:E3 ubiquitin-protein transferase RMND5